MKRIVFVVLVLLALGAVLAPDVLAQAADAGVVVAPPSVPSPDVGVGVVGLLDAVKSGKWLLAAAFAISLLTAGAKMLMPRLKDDRFGAIAVFAVGVLTILSAAVISGTAITVNVVLGALTVTFTAAGGYAWIKRIIWPDRTTG